MLTGARQWRPGRRPCSGPCGAALGCSRCRSPGAPPMRGSTAPADREEGNQQVSKGLALGAVLSSERTSRVHGAGSAAIGWGLRRLWMHHPAHSLASHSLHAHPPRRLPRRQPDKSACSSSAPGSERAEPAAAGWPPSQPPPEAPPAHRAPAPLHAGQGADREK